MLRLLATQLRPLSTLWLLPRLPLKRPRETLKEPLLLLSIRIAKMIETLLLFCSRTSKMVSMIMTMLFLTKTKWLNLEIWKHNILMLITDINSHHSSNKKRTLPKLPRVRLQRRKLVLRDIQKVKSIEKLLLWQLKKVNYSSRQKRKTTKAPSQISNQTKISLRMQMKEKHCSKNLLVSYLLRQNSKKKLMAQMMHIKLWRRHIRKKELLR
jgi:hypothetical protein